MTCDHRAGIVRISTRRFVMVAARNFSLHLGEMFLAMVVGMAALDAVFEGFLALAGTSYAVLVDDAPTAVALILMFNMTAPMLLWMRIRGHEASELSVMGAAMVVVGALTVFLLWLSAIDAGAICGVECGLMIPAMIAAMLLHPSLHATRRFTSGRA
jgi:flagellar biosynthetic protein FliP